MARPEKLCDIGKLKVGDFLSEVNYIKVLSVTDKDCEVEDALSGKKWTVSKGILETQAYTSDQFLTCEKVTRTELARILEVDIRDKVFSVCFNKMPQLADQEKMLETADLSTPAKRRKVAKDLGVGEERVMHAFATDTHEMGRLPVFDVQAKAPRLVDLRTIKWLCFANKKFELK
jgi:hypothetical protein